MLESREINTFSNADIYDNYKNLYSSERESE